MRHFSVLPLLLVVFFALSLVYCESCGEIYNCVEKGQSCADITNSTVRVNNDCRYGLYCNNSLLCTPYAVENEPCGGRNSLECRSDFYCSGDSITTTGSCLAKPQPTQYLFAGESCKDNNQCTFRNSAGIRESVCTDGKCKFIAENLPCTRFGDDYQCEYGVAYCNFYSKTCTKYLKDGDSCNIRNTSLGECGPKSYCVPIAASGSQGICQKEYTGKVGSFCDGDDDHCQNGLYCQESSTSSNDVCTQPNRKSVTLGMTCNYDSNCTQSNDESCTCTRNKKSSELNTETCQLGIRPKEYYSIRFDYRECIRKNGCDTDEYDFNDMCAQKYCKKNFCKYWNLQKEFDVDASYDCESIDICGAAAIYISPFLALFVLAALIFA